MNDRTVDTSKPLESNRFSQNPQGIGVPEMLNLTMDTFTWANEFDFLVREWDTPPPPNPKNPT